MTGFHSPTDTDQHGSPILHYAIGIGAPPSILHWILRSCDELGYPHHDESIIQMKDNNGIAAIHVASVYGNLPALHFLVSDEHGLDVVEMVNSTTQDGLTPMLMACEKNHLEIVKLLHTKGAVAHGHMNQFLDFPLWTASYHGNTDIVSWLLSVDGGAAAMDVHLQTARGDT